MHDTPLPDHQAPALSYDAPASRPGRLRHLLRSLPPLVLPCALWICATLVLALLADDLAPHVYSRIDLQARLTPPGFMGDRQATGWAPMNWAGTSSRACWH